MHIPSKYKYSFAIAAVLGVLASYYGGSLTKALSTQSNREGQALTDWLRAEQKTNVVQIGKWQAAVKVAGTNAISVLIEMLSKKPLFADVHERRMLAYWGFHALGTNASSAIPCLTKLTRDEDGEVRYCAVEALVQGVGLSTSAAKKILGPLANDPDAHVRAQVNTYLTHPEIYFSDVDTNSSQDMN